jgi:hypothetical protein
VVKAERSPEVGPTFTENVDELAGQGCFADRTAEDEEKMASAKIAIFQHRADLLNHAGAVGRAKGDGCSVFHRGKPNNSGGGEKAPVLPFED